MYFFFQAEDGIRDGHVTGVQTCALPIYRHQRGVTAVHAVLPPTDVLDEGVRGVLLLRAGGARQLRHGLGQRSEEHTSELQSRGHLVCRLLLEKKKKTKSERTDERARAYYRPA